MASVSRTKFVAVAAFLVLGLGAASSAAGESSDTGSLALDSALEMTSTPGNCPPEAPPDANFCAARVGEGLVPGLGRVSEKYTFYVIESACGSGDLVLETTVLMTVAGKGELRLALPRKEECLPSALDLRRPFTIVGGTGLYAGASGGGSVYHQAHYTYSGSAGPDTWTGTLNVPGVAFDVTAPLLKGNVNKTVRVARKVKRVRVRYVVTASDQVDGAVATSCAPRSGRFFRVGRTVVKCSGTDTSANTAAGRFSIVVKRRG